MHDPVHGTDDAYNYGLFDFHQQNFVLRFVRGQMWYWMAGFPAPQYIRQYERDNRSVWLQELELTPAAKLELQRFLEWNAEPEHRFYHYDYYRDNCSTRVRDALDRVLGGALRAQTVSVPSGTTYRFHTQRLTANDALVSTGLLVALGQGVDRPISAWDEMFLPLKLREHVRRVTVPGPNGARVPLVRSERDGIRIVRCSAARVTAFVAGVVSRAGRDDRGCGGRVGAMVTRECARAFRLSRGDRRVGAGGGRRRAGPGGTLGIHRSCHGLPQREPAPIEPARPAAVAGDGLDAVGGSMGAARCRGRARGGGVSILGLVLKLLPGFDQRNAPVIALALPAQLGIAAALRHLAQVPRVRVNPSRASG